MVSVYSYTDYRKFLGDYYTEHKSLHPHFSYQLLADRAGLKSKTYLHKVISGQKNLAKSSVLNVAKALKLKYNETEYFNNLVDFNNAKTFREKEFYFKKLKELAPETDGKLILHNQFEYFSKWYYVVIRELITLKKFSEDFKQLAKAVEPAITTDQAKKAVQTLCELGLIKKTPSGRYCQCDTALTTNSDITPLAVQLFQKECLNLASLSIEQHNRDIRDISTLTVGISAAGFDQIQQEIIWLRKRLVEIVKNDNPADRVYQVNFQLFPVSKVQSTD
ncbi:MAG: TIGR02147 family protein [Chitinispirillaceae bacterium]|nr:TIGR02147 family protein [Chitinispirillaceae bacterium]